MLDTLVKLASLGASGVCVLAIFWVGWLISKLPANASANQHRTVRMYMGMTIVIAIIAFASGIANAWFNADAISRVEKEKAELALQKTTVEKEFQTFRADTDTRIAKFREQLIRNDEVANSLKIVVDEKELAARQQNASEELKHHIEVLRRSINRLSTEPTGNTNHAVATPP